MAGSISSEDVQLPATLTHAPNPGWCRTHGRASAATSWNSSTLPFAVTPSRNFAKRLRFWGKQTLTSSVILINLLGFCWHAPVWYFTSWGRRQVSSDKTRVRQSPFRDGGVDKGASFVSLARAAVRFVLVIRDWRVVGNRRPESRSGGHLGYMGFVFGDSRYTSTRTPISKRKNTFWVRLATAGGRGYQCSCLRCHGRGAIVC